MLVNSLRQSSRALGLRFQSSKVSTTFLTASKEQTFKKAWLEDSATYPLIVVMGCAGVLVLGVGFSCLSFSPDVQIDPKKRNAIIRTWGLPGYKA